MRTHPPLFAQSSLLADGLWLPGFNCEKYFGGDRLEKPGYSEFDGGKVIPQKLLD